MPSRLLGPLRTGGGRQTRSLRFLGADHREYSFRSVDKDPSPVLDSLLRETFIDDLVQDVISAAHALWALVAAPLLGVAGILHVDPRLRLGRLRVVVPVRMGAFAFADAGRVFLDGDSPGGWHGSVGGDIWSQLTGHSHIVRWGVGKSDKATSVHIAIGLPY